MVLRYEFNEDWFGKVWRDKVRYGGVWLGVVRYYATI